MNLDNFTNGDMFHDTRTVLFIDEPGYRVWLTNLGNGEMAVQEQWPDVKALLDHNAAEAAEFSRNQKLGDMVKVASVPQWLVNQWEEETQGDKALLRRKLNDPDNAKFRTNGMRV
ncbi:hypothetical protein KX729_09175 [Rhizobium sp. XQZ8]|uniref:hypothetical protein n=1 Tax=Rhizobium populisoli TaxID=2859785 RepID=UPI001CA54BFB|nr:hypothetical protein [Rhizobium populisoli]MBW6421610.1 hypothetical protein [Rhizobium populisoli]